MNFLGTLGSRLRTADSNHYAIFKGMAAVTLFVFVGKLMSAGKEMAVAYRYGIGEEVDAYHFVFNLIGWPIGIWTSVLTAALVPLAVQLRQSGKDELLRFRAELLALALVLGVALTILAWIVIGSLLHFGWSGLPYVTNRLAQDALPGLILMLPLGLLVALQSAWMLSARRHVNTLLDSVPTVFICVAVLVFSGGGIEPLVWGTVVGGVFHLGALLISMVQHKEIEAPSFRYSSPEWRLFWQGFGIMLGGQALLSFTVIIDQFFAVGLGTGSIATLGYANRILSLILGLAAIAVSRATLPVFSQSKLDREGRMHEVAMYWVRLMFMLGVLAMVTGYLLAPWAVRLLFERGAFAANDTMLVAGVLRHGLSQLPFYFACSVFASYALSQHRYTLILWAGVIGFVSKVVANALLIPLLGINGITAGAVLMSACIALFFWLMLGRSKCKNR